MVPHEFFISSFSSRQFLEYHRRACVSGLFGRFRGSLFYRRRNSQRKWFRFVADQMEKTRKSLSLLTTKGYNFLNSLKVFPDTKELEQKSLSSVYFVQQFSHRILLNFNRSTFISCCFFQMHRRVGIWFSAVTMWASAILSDLIRKDLNNNYTCIFIERLI